MNGQTKAPAPSLSGGGSNERLEPRGDLLKLSTAPKVTGLSDGVQAASEFSPDDWKVAALAAIRDLACTGEVFSVEALRRRGIAEPDKPQRWGSLLAVARNGGVSVRVGVEEHRTPKGDGNLVRLWRGVPLERRAPQCG